MKQFYAERGIFERPGGLLVRVQINKAPKKPDNRTSDTSDCKMTSTNQFLET